MLAAPRSMLMQTRSPGWEPRGTALSCTPEGRTGETLWGPGTEGVTLRGLHSLKRFLPQLKVGRASVILLC